MSENPRLSRIESKLDRLSDAVVALARMEERMVTLFNRIDKYEQKQTELEDKVDEMSIRITTDGQTLRFAERLFWIASSAAVSFLFWTFR